MKNYLIPSLLFLTSAATTSACDSCGCELCEPGTLGNIYKSALVGGSPFSLSGIGEQQAYVFAGVSEQYTAYHSFRDSGVKVPNPGNEYYDSSITQFILGYQFNERLSVQLNIPYVYRDYQRLVGATTEKNSLSGLGDVSLHVNYVAVRLQQEDWSFSWSVSAGVKFPTGSASFLDELVDPSFPGSDIGGHDLALGSGSYDGSVGTSMNARWNRLFFSGDFEYAMRGTGHVHYRYANEMKWSGGPGFRLLQNEDYTLSLQLLATGEYKGLDTLDGVPDADTGITQLSLGPKIILALADGVVANIGVELPVIQHDTGLQAVADYRLKAGFMLRL